LHVSNDGSKPVILKHLLGRKKPDPSEALYAAIVAAARQETFYAQWLVPDTIDGRFDMMVLHVFLVLDRLRSFGAEASELSQSLTDRFFAEMDSALREVGVGDLVVGKKVLKMAEAFYGRATAYTSGLTKGEQVMADALTRNVFAEADAQHANKLANWSLKARDVLATLSLEDFKAGRITFE
jgi:cytochrome b pre-mRNA-processing protein 3